MSKTLKAKTANKISSTNQISSILYKIVLKTLCTNKLPATTTYEQIIPNKYVPRITTKLHRMAIKGVNNNKIKQLFTIAHVCTDR